MKTFREQITTLGRLQEIDIQIDRLKEEQRQIPVLIERTKGTAAAAEAKLEEKRANQKVLLDQRRAKERELEEHERRVKDDKSKLMNVKTNTEYQALLKEIEQIQQAGDERAEEVLLILEQVERAEIETKKALAQFDDAKKKVEVEAAGLQERLSKLPDELSVLTAQHEEMIKDLDGVLVKRYAGLRKQKGGVAIVKADGGVCHGCNMSVAPRMVNMLHQNEELVYCSNCQRILYLEGEARINRVQPVVNNN